MVRIKNKTRPSASSPALPLNLPLNLPFALPLASCQFLVKVLRAFGDTIYVCTR